MENRERLSGKIKNLEKSLQIIKDESAFKSALTDVNKTLQKLEEEIEEQPGTWVLGNSFSALDMFLAVVVHELSRLGYQSVLRDKPAITKLMEQLQFNSSYIELLGPLMNREVGLVSRDAGGPPEETSSPADSSEGEKGEIGKNLQEKKKNRKKASEDRSWYNLW